MNTTGSPVVKAPEKMEGVELAEALADALGLPYFRGALPQRVFVKSSRTDEVADVFDTSEPRAVSLVKETMRQRGFQWTMRDSREGGAHATISHYSATPYPGWRSWTSAGPDEGTAVFRAALAVARAQKEVERG